MDRKSKAFLDLCARFKVDPVVFAAIIDVESEWNPFAFRYEHGVSYYAEVEEHATRHLGNHPVLERTLQKCSFGLAQIMGATARDLGFQGPLQTLFTPELSVEWGLRNWARNAKRYERMTDLIAAYNAGSVRKEAIDGTYRNQRYVNKVLRAMGVK